MTSRKRRSELFGRALEILIEQPHGLAAPAVFQLIKESGAVSEEELTTHPSRSMPRFEELVWLSTVAPAKAGWLQNDPQCWMFTDEGKRQFHTVSCTQEFIS